MKAGLSSQVYNSQCIGSPDYSFEFTMLYDLTKAEPPDMELAKTFDAKFGGFKILWFSAKYDDTLGYPTPLVEWNEGSPTISHWEDRWLLCC